MHQQANNDPCSCGICILNAAFIRTLPVRGPGWWKDAPDQPCLTKLTVIVDMQGNGTGEDVQHHDEQNSRSGHVSFFSGIRTKVFSLSQLCYL